VRRFLCGLLGHPWIDNDYYRDIKICPCGRSAITNTHLIAAWPGDYRPSNLGLRRR
jgi:hypothetical protein